MSLATSADTMRKLQLCLTKQAEHDEKLNMAVRMLERVEINTKILLNGRKKVVLDFFMKPDANPQANLTQSIKLRHPTTGSWLISSESFIQWLKTPGSRLWLNGIPGGGKTVLAGAVIHEALCKSSSESDVGVAFFFCDYMNEAALTPVNILGAIASQLALQKDDAFDLLQEYYAELHPIRALNKLADVEELRAIVGNMSEFFQQVVIVVDGLDECGDHTHNVVESLSELATATDKTTIALFSRDEVDIRVLLEDDFKEVHIEAHTEDIEQYVRAEMESRIQSGRLQLHNTVIKDEIQDELVNRANGM